MKRLFIGVLLVASIGALLKIFWPDTSALETSERLPLRYPPDVPSECQWTISRVSETLGGPVYLARSRLDFIHAPYGLSRPGDDVTVYAFPGDTLAYSPRIGALKRWIDTLPRC